MTRLTIFFALSLFVFVNCERTITTASGSRAPARNSFASGDLIFEDNFSELDFETWQHENTLSGMGNWEFQWYTNNRSNSFVKKEKLHIVPTLVSDEFGEDFLKSGQLNLHGGAPADECTNPSYYGCERHGNSVHILNPIKSARLRTVNSFAFKYGTLEIRAKLPSGDWLWPALWLMPKVNAYGSWPSSGEIDLMESRGNRKLFDENNVNAGVEQVAHTLHFGPRYDANGWPAAHSKFNEAPGFNEKFHKYRMVWTNESITFFVDDIQTGLIKADEGFWKRGGFDKTGRANPWQYSPNLMAPFDQEFYLIINLAVGGVNYFPDNFRNEGSSKPWKNNSPQASLDFWNSRNDWLPTWNQETENSHLKVDYVRVWAL